MVRSDPSRKSKAHRVKGYLKKCKDALASKTVHEANPEIGRSAWYIADEKSKTKIENCDEKQRCHIIPSEIKVCDTSGKSDNKVGLSVVYTVETEPENVDNVDDHIESVDVNVETVNENMPKDVQSVESEVVVETKESNDDQSEDKGPSSESDDVQVSVFYFDILIRFRRLK